MRSNVLTHTSSPPVWALKRPRPLGRAVWDFIGAPLRMVLFPDEASKRFGLTSLRAERMAAVLPELRGRVLDVGAGAIRWGGGCTIIPSSDKLPFADASFNTVTFIACINHIPERQSALRDAHRGLKPGGGVVLTMIGRMLGDVGHKLWWYSDDKHRKVAEGEVMRMDRAAVVELLHETGFGDIRIEGFVYGLNSLYVARPKK